MKLPYLSPVLFCSLVGCWISLTFSSHQAHGTERLTLTDNSYLLGNLQSLTQDKKIHWLHHSADTPLEFDFSAVQSITLERKPEKQPSFSPKLLLEIYLKNGDFFRGTLLKLDKNALKFSTDFSDSITVDVTEVSHLVFLPESYKVIFDSSTDFKSWKKSSSKSWRQEQGDLISVFSGSTGSTLPAVDSLAIKFKAIWERSFYLALRLFSDSDGSNYGDIGYHLSFSNHRINLQSNKIVNGRTIRESIGSVLVDDLAGAKSGNFLVFANRIKKEFIVQINGIEYARWRDTDTEYLPQESGLLLINQGGNSLVQLEHLSISGWQGKYSPNSLSQMEQSMGKTVIYFKNGDATPVEQIYSTGDDLTIDTEHGLLKVPPSRIQRIDFNANQDLLPHKNDVIPNRQATEDQILLEKNKGLFGLNLQKIEDGQLLGRHPVLGSISIPLHLVKKVKANLTLHYTKEHLELLDTAHILIQEQKAQKALSILERARPSYRNWYWHRLSFLANNLLIEERGRFQVQPVSGKTKGLWLDSNHSILTINPKYHFSIWKNDREVHRQKISSTGNAEFKRKENEPLSLMELSNDFWLSKTEITHQQYHAVTGQELNDDESAKLPIQVNWQDAKKFGDILTKKNPLPKGFSWRLPTEAEWEYACRAGSKGPYHLTGKSTLEPNPLHHQKFLASFAWFKSNSNNQIQKVGQKKPNAWGFFDMHGNVAEWCLDAISYNKMDWVSNRKPRQINPLGKIGSNRIIRGGGFDSSFDECRAAYRDARDPHLEKNKFGFRIAVGRNQGVEVSNQKANIIDQVVQGLDGQIAMIKVDKGTFLQGSPSHEYLPDVTPSSDGKFILFCPNSKTLKKYNMSDSSVSTLYSFDEDIVELSISNDNKKVFVGCENGAIYIFDLLKNQVLSKIHQHSEAILAMATDPTGSLLVSAALDGKIALKNLLTQEIIWTLNGDGTHEYTDFIEFSQDSVHILTSGKYCPAQLLETSTGTSQIIAETKNNLCLKAKWHPSGRFILLLEPGGVIKQIEAKERILYRIINFELPTVQDFDISPNAKDLLLITEEGLCVTQKFPDDNAILIIHPNKKLEIAPDYFFRLSKQTDKPSEQNLAAHISRYNNLQNLTLDDAVSESPDGAWTVTTLDGKLRIWCQNTGTFFKTLGGNMISPFSKCTFSSCSRFIKSELQSGHSLIFPAVLTNPLKLSERLLREKFDK